MLNNLWVTSTEMGKAPSDRICPDEDINFKYSVDEICRKAYQELQERNREK